MLRTSAPLIGALGVITRTHMRDEFSKATRDLLAKRVGHVCTNPKCRKTTSGPQEDPSGAVNIGVAAHITAASTGGPRFDNELSPEQRIDSLNGIWLCQTCAKLIDSDQTRYSVDVLKAWKRSAERTAAAELARHASGGNQDQAAFAKAESLMPELLAEMRQDLREHKTTREAIILSRKWMYNGNGRVLFSYYFEDHSDLQGKFDVLTNLGFVRNIKFNNVHRYKFSEELVDYLSS